MRVSCSEYISKLAAAAVLSRGQLDMLLEESGYDAFVDLTHLREKGD